MSKILTTSVLLLVIIAGIVDNIGIVQIIDQLLGTHDQEQLTPGQIVKALILKCMGFVTAPLYLFSQFFEWLCH